MQRWKLGRSISAPGWKRVDVALWGAVQLDQGALGRQDAVAGAGYDKGSERGCRVHPGFTIWTWGGMHASDRSDLQRAIPAPNEEPSTMRAKKSRTARPA
jgi:hypothetical protein